LASGQVLWQMDLAVAFQIDPPTWGYCASPLIADGVLVVNPGAATASLVGLDPESGAVRWQTPGGAAAYASFLAGNFGGRRQLIGFDATSLGGWDPASGQRLWTLAPAVKGDFHVPTPVVVDGMLALSSENHGTRLYRFRLDGSLDPEPAANCADLAPDTTTPVATAGRLFGNWTDLYCLDLADGLRPVWSARDRAYDERACLIASTDRVLFVSGQGELLLLDATAAQHRVLSRQWAFGEPCEVYSHPALVGDRLYVRGSEAIRCLRLAGD
jgi:outer membrane protein assembly factor BamB